MTDLHDRLFACINTSSQGDSVRQSVTTNVDLNHEQGKFLVILRIFVSQK
jgi:hypothetical protein